MNKKIIKAEILWSRICNLNCSYCSMPTNDTTKKDIMLWEKGIKQLKKLDCGFVAIYGAEPLMDFDKLPEFINLLSKAEIEMTLITNCVLSDTKEKLDILYKNGLHSLSVSYDDEVSYDKSIRLKSDKGLETIRWFRDKYKNLRDVACIVTATNKNFWNLPQIIKKFTEEKIWTLFDFIHPDRKQSGSKCRNVEKDLLFKEKDIPKIIEILQEVKKLKQKGYYIHTSYVMLDTLIMHPEILLKNNWHCLEVGFPSWITVENTGEVYSCDDFHPEQRKKIYLWEIYDKFDEFTELWSEYVKQCPGCFWNTHFDANRIKMGIIPFNEYVHTKI